MKICIYGAGAIGGYMGAALHRAGCDVTLIARGPHKEAIQAHGLRLIENGEEAVYPVRCVENPEEAGPQDSVIITLKAHSVPAVAERLKPLFHDQTSVVTAMNGLPWWYFYELEGEYKDRTIKAVDPRGEQWSAITPERVIGCVVYCACDVPEPGLIRHLSSNRFTLGEPSGEKSGRAVALAEAMKKGGLKAPVRPRIREEIWIKLWGNLAFNPISALTGLTLVDICEDPVQRRRARAMMVEAQAIAEKLGITFPIDVDKRIDGAHGVGAHKTSMLQDLEAGRPMEIDALVTAVQELGQMTGVNTPNIDKTLAEVQELGRTSGCYPT